MPVAYKKTSIRTICVRVCIKYTFLCIFDNAECLIIYSVKFGYRFVNVFHSVQKYPRERSLMIILFTLKYPIMFIPDIYPRDMYSHRLFSSATKTGEKNQRA